MRMIVFDIDGVITDGTVIVDEHGKISTRINMQDIDAIHEIHRRGISIGAVTAEKNSFSEWVRMEFPWDIFYDGVNDKGNVLREIRRSGYDRIIYVGDGMKDLSAFEHADFRVCPMDAMGELKNEADLILADKAGCGQLWRLLQYAAVTESTDKIDKENIWHEHMKGHYELIDRLMHDDEYSKAVLDSAEIIRTAVSRYKRVVIFGNGGSAADAQHIAAEFIGRFRRERRSIDVEAISVNTSILTAIGNDYSFEDVFFRQIEGMLKIGDVAIGISTSGNSPNVIKALNKAKEIGAGTILLTGEKAESRNYDVVLKVCSDSTPRIQEMHILTGHFWADYVERSVCEE